MAPTRVARALVGFEPMSSVFSPTPDRLAALLSDSTMFTVDPESPDISYGLDIGTTRRTETGWSRLSGFTHYEAPGVQDREVLTLKLDYSDPSNPRLLVRSVLDETTRLTSNCYFGKAYLRSAPGGCRLVAFFALRGWREGNNGSAS